MALLCGLPVDRATKVLQDISFRTAACARIVSKACITGVTMMLQAEVKGLKEERSLIAMYSIRWKFKTLCKEQEGAGM
jgi:hypothetical protein